MTRSLGDCFDDASVRLDHLPTRGYFPTMTIRTSWLMRDFSADLTSMPLAVPLHHDRASLFPPGHPPVSCRFGRCALRSSPPIKRNTYKGNAMSRPPPVPKRPLSAPVKVPPVVKRLDPLNTIPPVIATAHGTSAQPSCSSRATVQEPLRDLHAVARAQRWLLVSIPLMIVSGILVIFWPATILVLIVTQLILIWRVADALRLRRRWLWVAGCMLPYVGMMVLYSLDRRATAFLHAHGFRVGLFGAAAPKSDRGGDPSIRRHTFE